MPSNGACVYIGEAGPVGKAVAKKLKYQNIKNSI